MTQSIAPGRGNARTRRIWLALPLAIFTALAGLFWYALHGGDPSLLPSAMIGKNVPDFTLPALDGLTADGAAGGEPFEGGQGELGHLLADHGRGQKRGIAGMQRVPEQAGKRGENDERKREPDAPRARLFGRDRLRHERAFLAGFAAGFRFGSGEAAAERRRTPRASSSRSTRRCLRSSSTMKNARAAMATKVAA